MRINDSNWFSRKLSNLTSCKLALVREMQTSFIMILSKIGFECLFFFWLNCNRKFEAEKKTETWFKDLFGNVVLVIFVFFGNICEGKSIKIRVMLFKN